MSFTEEEIVSIRMMCQQEVEKAGENLQEILDKGKQEAAYELEYKKKIQADEVVRLFRYLTRGSTFFYFSAN